jgi:hypothetical protein
MRRIIYACFLFFAFASGSFAKGPVTKKLVLVFENRMGKETIALGKTITTVLGETITIEKFKYYISHFSVTDNKGVRIDLPVQYFLVDENNPESKKITLSIPDIPISKIRFLLGVDSSKNVSGVQTGVLDPLNGMFWTWNTGYIMAKLEGTAEGLASAGHRFTHDIGGYKTGQNAARMIELSVPESDEIHIIADLNKWFNGKMAVRITDVPVCHSPGTLAMKIADNYATMFSVDTSN